MLECQLNIGKKSELGKMRNYFLKHFRYKSSLYTGLGIEDLSGMDRLFPGKKFVEYKGGNFPFKDREFQWVFSNAVIEHVGDDQAKIQFINEMLRVGEKVFFTTPSKHFIFETHTGVFLLHWNDKLFYRWCTKNRPDRNRNNLDLLDYCKLQNLLDLCNANHKIYRNRLLGLTMTFTVVCQKQQ